MLLLTFLYCFRIVPKNGQVYQWIYLLALKFLEMLWISLLLFYVFFSYQMYDKNYKTELIKFKFPINL